MSSASSRMLALLSLLQARRDWPGAVLAERLDVTPRTVRRDIDRLRELGYRIGATRGPDGGYRLAAGSELPPLMFDDDQAVAVAVGLQSAAASGVDVVEGAERALATMRHVMPSRLRHRIDAIRFTEEPAAVRVDPAVLEAVSAATRDRRTLQFDYGDREGSPRRVEPMGVVARFGRWYLVAWDLDREDWRIFRLDRMVPRSPGGVPFTPRRLPAVDARTFLAARAKGSAAVDRWPCTGEVIVEAAAAELAAWIRDGDVTELGPSACHVVMGSWSWAGLLAMVCAFDAPFTVVGPAPLRPRPLRRWGRG